MHFLTIFDRHCTLTELAAEMADITGLTFKLPNADYAERKAPFFYNIGTGYHALDSIGEVYQIPDYIWHQQGNGEIYIGSWTDSFWGNVEPLEIPTNLFKSYQPNGMATIAAIPKLRPGALLNGQRVISIILKDQEMTLKWRK